MLHNALSAPHLLLLHLLSSIALTLFDLPLGQESEMAEEYSVLMIVGDDFIPLTVPKTGTFRDLKRAYNELFDVPPAQQVWGGAIGDLGVDDDVRY